MAITLNANLIYTALSNQIISQYMYSDNVAGITEGILSLNRVDGSLFGDTKTYQDSDILETYKWGNDAEAANLLELNRPKVSAPQLITLNQFRQLRLTLDQYLTKQAWMSPEAFSDFNSREMKWLQDTKLVNDICLHNAFVGCDYSSATKGTISVAISTAVSGLSGEEKARVTASTIAQALDQLLRNMTSPIHAFEYTDNGTFHTYNKGDIVILWNNKYISEIEKRDLPTIFHKDGLFEDFGKYSMDAQYFGVEITSSNLSTYSAATPASGKPINSSTGAYTPGTNNANGKVCAKKPMFFKNDGTFRTSGTREDSSDVYVMPGFELPAGAIVNATNLANSDFAVYIVDDTVICKVTVAESVPLMSGFEVGTEFQNARSLTVNHYLTYGYNDLAHLKGKPLITVKAA